MIQDYEKLSREMDTLERLRKIGLVKDTEYSFVKSILERNQGEL